MFELELRCTLVENACGALCRQVLRGRACKAEENLPAKCTDCSFNLNVNDELVKYPNAKLARRGVLGIPPSYIYICTVYFCPKVVNALLCCCGSNMSRHTVPDTIINTQMGIGGRWEEHIT